MKDFESRCIAYIALGGVARLSLDASVPTWLNVAFLLVFTFSVVKSGFNLLLWMTK